MSKLKKAFLSVFFMAVFYVLLPAAVKAEAADWSGSVQINDVGVTTNSQMSMAVLNNELYVAFVENTGSVSILRVKKYNGISWEYVDGGSVNYNIAQNANDPCLIVFNNILYVAWGEANSEVDKYVIHVRKYNGGSIWTFVDGGALNGISLDPGQNSNEVSLEVLNGNLYAVWTETVNGQSYNHIHVKKCLGDNNWIFADDNVVNGLNYTSTDMVVNPSVVTYNNKLYVAWSEPSVPGSSYYQLRVKCYDGGSWSFVDGGGIYGINGNSNLYAQYSKLLVMNNSLYVLWYEMDSVNNDQVRLKRFENDGTWTFVDSGKLNITNPMVVYNPVGIQYNDELYLSWIEDPQYTNQYNIRAVNFDGTAVTYLDGGSVASKINDSNADYYTLPVMAVLDNTLYVAWVEGTSIICKSLVLPHGHVTPSASLTETNLDSASLALTIEGTSFSDNSLDKSSFTLVNAPSGLTVESVTYNSSTECTINLAFNSDFDTDISNLKVNIAGTELLSGKNMTDTNILSIAAVNDSESISMVSDGEIIEGAEDGEKLTVTITGGTFADSLNISNWTVANLPGGVTKGTVTRIDDHTAAIELSGNSTQDYDSDITNISVSIAASEYKDSSGNDTLTADTGVVLTAKTVNVTVSSTSGGTVKLNDTDITVPYSSEFMRATTVTLTAAADSDYRFAYWIDPNTSAIVSTNAAYSFYAGTTSYLKAVFYPVSTEQFTVVFRDATGRILSTQTITNGSSATAPADPYLMGYQFLGWNKDYSAVTSDLEISPQYKRLAALYNVTVNNGTLSSSSTSGSFQYDKLVTVIADAAPSGQVFDYWTMNGVIVSRNPSYSFYTIMDTMVLTAVYTDITNYVPNTPLIALFNNAAYDSAQNMIQFTANRDTVPTDYTLIESGILLLKESSSWSGELTLDTVGVTYARVKNTSKSQFYIRKLNVNSGETWYARAYMICQDSSGTIHIIYSVNTVSQTMP